MTEQRSMKKVIPIFIAALFAWIHNMGVVPLGYVYNTYQGMDALVMSIVIFPGIIATVSGLLAGKLMEKMGRKNLVVFSMIIMLIGGLGMCFVGDQGIGKALFFSAISGFPAGTIPAVGYANLAVVAPEKMKDKVYGWSDALCSIGLAIAMVVGGFLSADGVWTRTYAFYFVMIPVLIITIIMYPKDSEAVLAPAAPAASDTEEKSVSAVVKSVLPKCIIALIIFKIFSGMFYSCFGMFSSDYIINELQLGSSALVGSVNTATQIVNIAASAVIFLWLKFFKGFSNMIAQVIIGIGLFFIVFVGSSIPGIFICAILTYLGLMSSHSSLSTIMGLVPEGNAVGRASGMFLAATFVGESTCGYVVPVISRVLFGVSSAGNCMKIGGVLSIVVGLASLPFFIKAYKIMKSKENNQAAA